MAGKRGRLRVVPDGVDAPAVALANSSLLPLTLHQALADWQGRTLAGLDVTRARPDYFVVPLHDPDTDRKVGRVECPPPHPKARRREALFRLRGEGEAVSIDAEALACVLTVMGWEVRKPEPRDLLLWEAAGGLGHQSLVAPWARKE